MTLPQTPRRTLWPCRPQQAIRLHAHLRTISQTGREKHLATFLPAGLLNAIRQSYTTSTDCCTRVPSLAFPERFVCEFRV